MPWAAIVAYACVISSGETPPAPRITDGVCGRWSDVGMPRLYAILATFWAPMSIARRA
jgi:hypothetical protein